MKANWKVWFAAAIIVIVSTWATIALSSSFYNQADQASSLSEISLALLMVVLIDTGALLVILSSARTYLRTNAVLLQQSVAREPVLISTAQIVPKVKSHPLPPLWR